MANPSIDQWKCNNTVRLRGDVTQLQAIAMATPADISKRLGLAPERLVRGYWICLLKINRIDEDLAKDFIYAGTTMRSGGRMGLPAMSKTKDQERLHSDRLLQRAYGKEGYRNAQLADFQRISERGHNRLVKIVTVVRHIDTMLPAIQYPSGGAHLQWTLINPRKFICGAFVDGAGLATTKAFLASIAPDAPQENFFKLERYLEQL